MKRREFLATGGALVVAFAWRGGDAQVVGTESAPINAGPLSASFKKLAWIDGWVRVGADGGVTVFTGKAELGQGIKTALIQVAAEELFVTPARCTIVTADTDRTGDEGYTSGSHSMQDSGTAIRQAAAQTRNILLGLAAQKLDVPLEQLAIDQGVIRGGGKQVAYGELVAGGVMHVEAQIQDKLLDPKKHTIVGKSLARVDIPAKVAGGAAYVQDMRPAGMVHGRIVRPPSPGAVFKSLDATEVERMPGVLKVLRDGRFIGVIAQREYQAIVAMRRLAVLVQWDLPPTLPSSDKVYDGIKVAPVEETVIFEAKADVPNDPQVAGMKTVTATYRRPYQMHGAIGPSCALAQLDGDRYTVWTHTQGVYPLRKALAAMLKVPEPQVRCIHTEGSGCYGHNGADDVAADAVLLARALPGKPVRVQWMRDDEHAWEPYGPPMIVNASGTVDTAGNVVDWQYDVASNTHSMRPGLAGDLIAAQHLAEPFPPSKPKPLPLPEGGGDRNAIPLYKFPNQKIVHRFLPQMPLRISALRSLGAYVNVYAIESFVDELARAANADPVAFRIRHLKDPRALDVIRMAADRFKWNAYTRQATRGRGFAFARYKNLAGYAAIACEVEVHRDTGAIRILRVVAAVDGGECVNPDGMRNQVEGGVVQSASWTTMEEVRFDDTRILSRDWGAYPILRFPQVPEAIDVHIIDRPGTPFLGMGEVTQGPTAAAIANAVADATGVRVRDLPLDRARIRAALPI
jgi:nicotinate dehydrogenase subunit B